jgi:hypothetical protein
MFFQVGKVIVQTTAKQLPKLLTRFKGAKQIKNPTSAQMDNAGKITGNLSNFTKAERKILKTADTARPSIVQSLTGTGRTGAQETAKKGLKGTGESRRSLIKGLGIGIPTGSALTATVGVGGKIIYDLRKGKTDNKKPQGADPKGLMKPKKNTVDPFKKKVEQPKKKPNIPPKAPPSRPKKAEDKKKKTTQLYMKEKKTGKDSNVKFNSRGGMLKKGKK